MTYDWTIDEQRMWPPSQRPNGPFGPSTIEVMRSCPLRCCFEASSGYERRTGYAARIGTAFHRTLQSLIEEPPQWSTVRDIAEAARTRFLAELAVQEAQRAARPREVRLPKDENRVNRATEAIMAEALRVVPAMTASLEPVETGDIPSGPVSVINEMPTADGILPAVEAEVPVQSQDGLLHGRVDRAEHSDSGTRLVDYKSALRDDLPERYERQMQLYAVMWHDTRGEWPVAAEVIYPFTSSSHLVNVSPAVCDTVAAEARQLIEHVQRSRRMDQLATPGDVCKACEFRPWCNPFWQRQSDQPLYMHALTAATQGFEGVAETIEQVNGQWRLYIRWRGNLVRLVAPMERFSQLEQAHPGARIRALDMRLQGNPYQPQVVVTDYSELFLLV